MKLILRKIILWCLRLYQRTLSPDHGYGRYFLPQAGCKYYPSCSEYAYQVFENFGLSRAIFLSLKRIAKCHPWAQGGYDPVESPKVL